MTRTPKRATAADPRTRETKGGQGCPLCRPLWRERRLGDYHKYNRIAARIDAALAAGDLIPDPDEPWASSYDPKIPYSTMRADELAGRGLPDTFSFHFRCTACNARFLLSGCPYHGAEGEWRVVGN